MRISGKGRRAGRCALGAEETVEQAPGVGGRHSATQCAACRLNLAKSSEWPCAARRARPRAHRVDQRGMYFTGLFLPRHLVRRIRAENLKSSGPWYRHCPGTHAPEWLVRASLAAVSVVIIVIVIAVVVAAAAASWAARRKGWTPRRTASGISRPSTPRVPKRTTKVWSSMPIQSVHFLVVRVGRPSLAYSTRSCSGNRAVIFSSSRRWIWNKVE